MELPTRIVSPAGLGIEFEVVEGDAIIGPAIEGGSWADHETALFLAHVESGTRVLDLGANVGWFSVQAVLAGAEVHAFEPVPALAAIAQRNVERAMAKGPGRGTVHALAAGAERSRATIAIGASNLGDNRVLDAAHARPQDMGSGQEVEIEIAPVDELVQGSVGFVKIDTQGSEWLAIQGARKLLEASPDLGLLIEFWPYALRGASPEQLLSELDAMGFTLGKATEAPYPMSTARILEQALARDPVRGGLDLYGVRGKRPFHVLGTAARLRGVARSLKEA